MGKVSLDLGHALARGPHKRSRCVTFLISCTVLLHSKWFHRTILYKLLSPEVLIMQHKLLGGRGLPGPAGSAYSAPSDPLAGLWGWGPQEGEG